jgi:hypothetical protein
MFKRQVPQVVCASAVAAMGLGFAPAAHADHTESWHIVRPGESIQAAVDKAKPGDTVQILPGTYKESVEVTVSDLTIRGAGPRTVIIAGAKASGNACAKAGHGLCVTGTADHTVSHVRIQLLTVKGFAKNGISATQTDRMRVSGVVARDNGDHGISQEKSTRGVFEANVAHDNGQSGIFLANSVDTEGPATDTKGTLIRHNHLSGNRIGVVLRRVRNLSVQHNIATGNCGGVFVVGDESVPRGGALTVQHNLIYQNNKYCPPNARLPFIQGTGILLTGVEDTVVRDNQVRDNVGKSPMSGGIVLFRSVVGAPNARNAIRNNQVTGNEPFDLADRDTGTDNTFTGNKCKTSEPAGRC